MRKQLYLDIKNRLEAVKNEQGEQLFRHIDLWNRQTELNEQEIPFACPAVFIEFMPMVWKTRGNSVRDCELTVRLHVVTEPLSGIAGEPQAEQQVLECFDIIDVLTADLRGFGTDYMNGWMHTQSITSHHYDRYADNVEECICNVRDFSAVREYVPVTPGLSIIPQ
ncbi:MAG: hypothetical protein LBR52_04770 [Prevotellaceae bacterium]|jgi:hypothetical protein|nr:hypothetical protein [Prevotellaceae bacterium]